VAARTENQKAKGKNQKAKISERGRGPGWERIFLSGAENRLSRGVFAAREEMGL